MKWLADPVYMRQAPPRQAQWVLLGTLLWVALPLLLALPVGVGALFVGLWCVRAGLLWWHARPLPWWGAVLLTVLAGVVVFLQLGTVIGREGGVAWLLLLVLLKAYETQGLRDWQVMLLAMLVLMGGAMLFNQSLWMAPWLLLSLWLLTSSMGLISAMSARAAVKQGALALALAAPMAAVLFVLMPRKAEPLWRIPQMQSQVAKTGLSDTLQPGSISHLIQTNELAFNATFDSAFRPQPQQLYWRVMVMAQNDGAQWRAMDERYTDEDSITLDTAAKRVRYQLILRDEEGRIPALDYPIVADRNGLSTRVGDVVRVNRSRDGWRRIRLQAALSPYLGQALSRGEQAFYTALPKQYNRRTQDLAQQLNAGVGNTEAYVARVLRYFKEESFRYTLQPQRGSGSNSTDYFLFDGREGFCEDYADAFVWLMRSVGVPARIMTGYQGGQYHAEGGFWQVRSKDAHAWAEVWLPEKQAWWRVDPTAAVSISRIDSGITQSLPEAEQSMLVPRYPWLDNTLQSSQFYWQQWVVNFDANRQQNLFAKLGLAQRSWPVLAILAGVVMLLAALPLLFWCARAWRGSSTPMNDGLMLLKQAVLDGNEHELAAIGPDQLKTILMQQQWLTPALAQLLAEYSDALYAQVKPPEKRIQRRWYRRMKTAVKHLHQAHLK